MPSKRASRGVPAPVRNENTPAPSQFQFGFQSKALLFLLLSFNLLTSLSLTAYANSPYATEVIHHNNAFGNNPLYNDPYAILGEPTRIAINNDPAIGMTPFHVKIVEPAYNRDPLGNKVITTLSRKPDGAGDYTYGSITVKFDQPVIDDPTNPYGIDLNVFGNSFYVGDGYISDATDMRSYHLVGGIFAEPVVISISPDNINWYTYTDGPYGDTAFPTQGHLWSATQHDLTGNGWTSQTTDFTKPVNPTLGSILGAPGQTLAVSDAIETYVNSGGGTGIDLTPSGFSWIQYVRVESTAQFRDGEIDAFADVRPAHLGEALSVTPANATQNTPFYFQSPSYESHTSLAAHFSAISDLAKLSTAPVSDLLALSALSSGTLLTSYDLQIMPLIGTNDINFTANYQLSPGTNYSGNGSDLSLLQWDGTTWQTVEFAFDPPTTRLIVNDWSNPAAIFAIIQTTTQLAGDFNSDGHVNAADYVLWRKGAAIPPIAENYDTWRHNFGSSSASHLQLATNNAVPEPNSHLLIALIIAACPFALRARRGVPAPEKTDNTPMQHHPSKLA